MNIYLYRVVDDPAERVRLMHKFSSEEPAADAADSSDHLLLSVSANGKEIGIARGQFLPQISKFHILVVALLPGWRNTELTRALLSALIEQADARFHPEEFFWEYIIKDGASDPFLRLAQGIPGIEAHSEVFFRRYRIHLNGPFGLAARYTESNLEKKGYRILRYHDLSSGMKAALEARIRAADAKGDLRNLHPFVEDHDESTSLFLLEKDTGSLCGWVVCRLIGPKTLEVRRWYTFPGRRAKMPGIYLIGYWLNLVALQYTGIEFVIMAGHDKTILPFCRNIFKESLEELFCERKLRITRKPISAS